MTPLLEQLRLKARAATPGPWIIDEDGDLVTGNRMVLGQRLLIADVMLGKDQLFIASANPETILKLLDALDVMRVALDKIVIPVGSTCSYGEFLTSALAHKALNRAKEILG